MSEEQAVYNAKRLAEKCEKIAERIDEAANKLGWSELERALTVTRLEPFVLMEIGARIADINEQVAQIVQEVHALAKAELGTSIALAAEGAEAVERNLTGYAGGDAIVLPVLGRSSAAFLVELGGAIMRRQKAMREAANDLRLTAAGINEDLLSGYL